MQYFIGVFVKDFERNYYLVGSSKLLDCKNIVPETVLSAVKASLSKDSTTAQELYFNIFANKFVGNALDEATKTRVATNLQNILKADDSLSKYVTFVAPYQ